MASKKAKRQLNQAPKLAPAKNNGEQRELPPSVLDEVETLAKERDLGIQLIEFRMALLPGVKREEVIGRPHAQCLQILYGLRDTFRNVARVMFPELAPGQLDKLDPQALVLRAKELITGQSAEVFARPQLTVNPPAPALSAGKPRVSAAPAAKPATRPTAAPAPAPEARRGFLSSASRDAEDGTGFEKKEE